jgi:hypothetical protein
MAGSLALARANPVDFRRPEWTDDCSSPVRDGNMRGDVMRSLVLFTIGGALLMLALASGCKSDSAAAKASATDPDTSAAGGATTGEPADPVPALPTPRRFRSGESPDDATGDDSGRRRPGFRGPRSEEMRQRMAEMRQKYDTNGDGDINGEERDAMRQARIKERVSRIDSNADGTISREEAEATPGGRVLRDFDAVDANQDSKISPEELEAAMSERQSRRRERFRDRDRDRESDDAPEPAPAD